MVSVWTHHGYLRNMTGTKLPDPEIGIKIHLFLPLLLSLNSSRKPKKSCLLA